MYTLLTDRSISDGKTYDNRIFTIKNKWIHDIKSSANFDNLTGEMVDLRGLTVLPGLIDIHTHGGIGHDIMTALPEDINAFSVFKLEEGVTSFFPATITAPLEATRDAIANISAAISKGTDGAKIAGILLEGPFLNPEYKGAHLEQYLKPNINLDELASLILAAKLAIPDGCINITIAPELENAIEAIASLTMQGINCCIGHSSATCEQARVGIQAGAKIATHLYNAMTPLHHRNPGVVGAVLSTESIWAEIICDLVHVHPTAIKTAVMAKGPEKTVLITDSVAAAGLPDGGYAVGDVRVIMKDGVCRTPDGNLAGSSVRLIDCVRNMHEKVGVSFADAVTMATIAPARAIGLDASIGSLEKAKNADIIAIDDNFNVRFVMVDGVIKKPL